MNPHCPSTVMAGRVAAHSAPPAHRGGTRPAMTRSNR
jgi:hypothetical protein